MKQWLPVLFIAAMAGAPFGGAAAQGGDAPTALPSGKTERTVSASATVQAIDLSTRTIVLRRGDGTDVTAEVDKRVKNLPQVKVGDRVQVSYRESLAFQVRPAGEAPNDIGVKEALTTAKPGDRPAGVATREITIVATIDAIDSGKPSVRLRTADGEVTEVKVRDPNNLAKVKVGDQVEVTYAKALAISVTAAQSAASGSSAPATSSGGSGSSAPPKHANARATTKELNRQELDLIQSRK